MGCYVAIVQNKKRPAGKHGSKSKTHNNKWRTKYQQIIGGGGLRKTYTAPKNLLPRGDFLKCLGLL